MYISVWYSQGGHVAWKVLEDFVSIFPGPGKTLKRLYRAVKVLEFDVTGPRESLKFKLS